MKHVGDLTMQKAIGWGGLRGLTEGQMLAARFCGAVSDGQAPDVEDLKAVAYALSVLMEGSGSAKNMSEVARRLGVQKKQGKKLAAERNAHFSEWEVAQYFELVEANVRNGMTEKAAELTARQCMAKHLGIHIRTMGDKVKKHGKGAHIQREILNTIREMDRAQLNKVEA